MAWTAPRTWVTGEVVTSSQANTHFRDNQVFLHDPPSCRVFNSASILVPNATETALTFNSERWDTDSMHSTSSLTSRITFNTAGKYIVTGHVRFAGNASGFRSVGIRFGGTTYLAANEAPTIGAGSSHDLSVATVYAFPAASFAELVVFHDIGASLNAEAVAAISPEFAALWVSG